MKNDGEKGSSAALAMRAIAVLAQVTGCAGAATYRDELNSAPLQHLASLCDGSTPARTPPNYPYPGCANQ